MSNRTVEVDLRTTNPGVVVFGAGPAHILRVHAGPPVRGACQSERFVYQKGDIDLFPAGIGDTWEEDDASTFLLMQVPPSLLQHAPEPRHHFRDPQIEHIAWALEAEKRAGYPTGSAWTESLGLAVALRLQPSRSVGGLTARQLRRVTEYVEDNLDGDLSLTALADIAGASVSHLKDSFRKAKGMPVHRYIIHRRVERAKTMLLRGGMPVSQVALEVGFAHQSHLARWMRRVLGCSPSEVR